MPTKWVIITNILIFMENAIALFIYLFIIVVAIIRVNYPRMIHILTVFKKVTCFKNTRKGDIPLTFVINFKRPREKLKK